MPSTQRQATNPRVSNSATKPTSASAQHSSSGTSVEMIPADTETPGSVAKASADQAPMRCAIEPPPKQEHDERGSRVQQRGGQANAGFAGPHDVGRGADDPGDQRRLGVVAERRLLAPGPVLRLVEEQVGGVELQRHEPRRPAAAPRPASRTTVHGPARAPSGAAGGCHGRASFATHGVSGPPPGTGPTRRPVIY